MSQAIADDVDGSDRDGDKGGSEPVGFGNVGPELLRVVNKAIILELSL